MKHKNSVASALLLILSLCFIPTLAEASPRAVSAATPKCKALLVGMDYGSSSANWTANATAMQTALLTWSCWRKGTIKLITGKATAWDIDNNLSAMNIGANDFFIFYYSGHANKYSGSERVPALNSLDEALYTTTSPRGLTDNNLTACLNQSSPNNYRNADKIVILDCCYSAGFWNGNDLGRGGDLEKIPRTALLASTSEDKKSPASSEFTGYLVQGITRNATTGRAPADTNNDSVLTAREWYDYASSRVNRAPIFGYRKQTEEEPLENETTLSTPTWTYNDPEAVDTDGVLQSAVSFPVDESVGGAMVLPNKLVLLAPYIGLALIVLVATAAITVCVRHVKRRRKKR